MDAQGRGRLATVVITNRNYACYLRDAVDSALRQSHGAVEVVVVDDASEDRSPDILRSYGDAIRPVLLEENVGQLAAFSAGFERSQGDPIVTLDADDVLLPTAVAAAVAMSEDPDTVHMRWPVLETDERLAPTGLVRPRDPLPQGDRRSAAAALGPGAHLLVPTSGNAFSRAYLERVLPGPHREFRVALDAYLSSMAPLFGKLSAAGQPQALYRAHPDSSSRRRAFDRQLELNLHRHQVLMEEYARWCAHLGFPARPEAWWARSWFHRLRRAVGELDALIPSGTPFVLIDEGQWNVAPDARRRPLPFLERDGCHWGRPPDSATAIRELERMRRGGAEFAAVAWPAFWWLDYYDEFEYWLRAGHTCLLDTDRLILFDLHA